LSRVDEWDILHHKDDGPGIQGAERDNIFDTFKTSHSKGIGLGLSISRTIIEAHGGSITLKDDHPGATFIIKLPTNMEH